jgi:hypothetical protein
MENQQPTAQELQALILVLQAQAQAMQNAAPAIQAAPAAAATPVAFADTPQMLGIDDLIDYSTKRGQLIYEQGCKALNDKALTNGFNVTPNKTVVFVEAFQRYADAMGWTKETKQITTFTTRDGKSINIIKNYGQINKATLKTACEQFCKAGEIDSQTRAKQNNMMMSNCLSNPLSMEAKVRLLTYQNDYTFHGVEYAPLMYKVIMRLATIDSIATTQTLRDNLQNLGVFAATVNGDIDKINSKFNQNYSQIIAQGATVDNPIGIIFEAYSIVPCYNFTTYMKKQHEDYLDEKLTVTHEALMALAKAKMDYLKLKGKWGAKSPDDKKIVAMAAKITALKGQLKLDPKLSAIAEEGKKRGNKGDKGEKGKKWKNKKNTSNKKDQKRDEAWKQVPPKENEKKEKQVGKYTYNWCKHHMAWTVHKPTGCELGKKHKDNQRKDRNKANPAVVASAAATTINPCYTALLATLANIEEE